MSPRQQWPLHRTKNGVFFQSREQVTVRPGQIRRTGWVIKTLEAQVGHFLGCKCPVSRVNCRARTRPFWWLSRSVFPSKCPSIAPAEMRNPPRWQFGPLEDNQWGGCCLDPKKSRRQIFQRIFALGIFWGVWVSRYAATPLIVALSPGQSDTTRFRPWSPIATGYHLDRAEKIPKVAQTTGILDVSDPRSGFSGPTKRRASACPNLHEWWTQPAHVGCPVAQLLI